MRFTLVCAVTFGLSASFVFAQAASLRAPSVVLPVDSAPFQRLLDFDKDGDMDAVGTRIFSTARKYEVLVWRNDKGVMTEVFRAEVTRSIKDSKLLVMRVETGDWNNDGYTDFVVGRGDVTDLFVAQLGTPKFQRSELKMLAAYGAWSIDVGFADFDGDKRDDIAVLEAPKFWNLAKPRLTVHLAKGGTVSTEVNANVVERIDVLDADGDTAREIALYRRQVYQTFQLDQGKLKALQTLTTTITPVSTMPFLWMAGDIDGDKDDDVVVFQPALGRNWDPLFQIFRRTGATTFRLETKAIGGPAEYLADIDGDGDLDGVCCGGGGSQPKFWPKLNFASTFELSLNDGKGGFAMAWAFPGSGSKSLAGVADLDGDGDVELVAGRVIFHGEGPWKDHPMPPTGTNMAVLRQRLITDGDRDGDLDLMHNPYGGGRNAGDGTFVTPRLPGITPPTGRKFSGGFEIDYDGDGAVDRVVPMFEQLPRSRRFEYMVLLRNNGGGTYHYVGPVAAKGARIGWGYTVDNFASGDVDGDGDNDLIANSRPDREGYKSEIWLQKAGQFVPGQKFPNHRFEALADFNKDGKPDLLVTIAGALRIMHGTRNATTMFGVGIDMRVRVPFHPNSLVVVDLNGDKRLDIIAPTTPNPTLILNLTSGWKHSVLTGIETTAKTSFVSAGDFSGDGNIDMVVGPLKGEPGVAMLLICRDNPSSPRTLADYHQNRMVIPDGFAADIDSDGDTDLVGTHTIFSTKHSGSSAGSRRQVGKGVPGQGGSIPILGAAGIMRSGQPVKLILRGLPGPTTAFLGISTGPGLLPNFPANGLTFRLDAANTLVIPILVTEKSNGRGAASWVLAYQVPATAAGYEFHLQAVVVDPAAANGATCTNALIERIGR